MRNLAVLSVAVIGLALTSCDGLDPENVEYGSGLCFNQTPMQHSFGFLSELHVYIVQDSTKKTYNLPVRSDNMEDFYKFIQLRACMLKKILPPRGTDL